MLFWDYSRLAQSKCTKGAGARPNYLKRLLKECAQGVDIQSDEELAKLMCDRQLWVKHVENIVRENYN